MKNVNNNDPFYKNGKKKKTGENKPVLINKNV